MIKTLEVNGFKCFKESVKFSLKPVTLLYGKNGRGKSTLIQALLLLGQSMRKNNSLDTLIINGAFVNQGTFEELLNKDNNVNSFELFLESDKSDTIKLGFSGYNEFPGIGELYTQTVNGVETFGRLLSSDDEEEYSSEQESEQSSGVTSDISILQELKQAIYISADRLGPQNESEKAYPGDDVFIDPIGINLIKVLAEQSETFVNELEYNLSQILSGARLSIKRSSDKIELKLNSSDNGPELRPINVGYGYSYVLPVIVSGMLAKPDSLLIIENPEAHLHPGAQSRLTRFLINQSLKNKFQLIIETHSDHVINGLRIATRNKIIKHNQSIVLHFSHKEMNTMPTIIEIKCDSSGNLSQYPEDFMDEWTKQLLDLV